MKKSGINGGFNLIELGVVIIISSFLMTVAIQVYRVYIHDMRYHETVDGVNTAYSSLYNYQSAKNSFPFPSDPTISIYDADGGCECGPCSSATACADLKALAVGTCNASGGICKIAGARDTAVDPDNAADPVYIGGLPYKTIREGIESFPRGTAMGMLCTQKTDPSIPKYCDADSNGVLDIDTAGDGLQVVWIPTAAITYQDISWIGVLDPWGYQMGYAVSASATDPATIAQGTYGAIDIQTESSVELLSPPRSANFVIIAHGDNHMGAYTPAGILPFPCGMGTGDYNNCSRLPGALFIDGLRSMGNNNKYFDDVIRYSSFSLSKVWDYTSTGSDDIYNLNIGNVGVALAPGADPQERLDVAGSLQISNAAIQNKLCNISGTSCWSPNLLAGPKTGAGSSGNLCGPPANPSNVKVMTGIVNGVAQCMEIPKVAIPGNVGYCPAGKFVMGFNNGALDCTP